MSEIADNRIDPRVALERAATGLGKVDYYGARGIALVNHNEIEAMAIVLAGMGLAAVAPGQPMPEALVTRPEVAT